MNEPPKDSVRTPQQYHSLALHGSDTRARARSSSSFVSEDALKETCPEVQDAHEEQSMSWDIDSLKDQVELLQKTLAHMQNVHESELQAMSKTLEYEKTISKTLLSDLKEKARELGNANRDLLNHLQTAHAKFDELTDAAVREAQAKAELEAQIVRYKMELENSKQNGEGGMEGRDADADAEEVIAAFEQLRLMPQSSKEDDRTVQARTSGGLEDLSAEARRVRAEVSERDRQTEREILRVRLFRGRSYL